MVYWCILVGIVMFFAGLAVGLIVAYKLEHKTVDELLKRCRDANDRLENMIKQEEEFVESMWPKRNHIIMETNLADYLKAKYLADETECNPDCEDESDNLYV